MARETDDELSPIEQKWATAFQKQQPKWTPDCIDPEVMVELAAKKNQHPHFDVLMLHVAGCRYCLQAYQDTTFCLTRKAQLERELTNRTVSADSTPVAWLQPWDRKLITAFIAALMLLFSIVIVLLWQRNHDLQKQLTGTRLLRVQRDRTQEQLRLAQQQIKELQSKGASGGSQQPKEIPICKDDIITVGLSVSTKGIPLPAELRTAVIDAVYRGIVKQNQKVAETLSLLAKQSVVRSSDDVPVPRRPMRTLVRETRPQFRFQPAKGITDYEVAVFNKAGERLWLRRASPDGHLTYPQDEQQLDPGQIYSWKVFVTQNGDVLAESTEVYFGVLSAERSRVVERLRSKFGQSALAMGVAYAREGLYEDAIRELTTLVQRTQNPHARNLLEAVKQKYQASK